MSIIVLINGHRGSVFVESLDSSGYSKFVPHIREKNMIRVVIDNARYDC